MGVTNYLLNGMILQAWGNLSHLQLKSGTVPTYWKKKVYEDPLLTYPLVSVPSILTLNPQDQCSGRGANGFIYGASCMEKETVQPPMNATVHSQNVEIIQPIGILSLNVTVRR